MATGQRNGWKYDAANSRLSIYVDGTEVARLDDATNDLALINSNGLTSNAAITATAGDISASAAGAAFVATAGNVELGNPGAFATTQPQGAVVMGGTSLSGIAPVGAITTAGAVFASDTVVRKIIAAGTASNVET